jgi:hypothetical protein
MRRPFGKLMDLLEDELHNSPGGTTMGQLSEKYDEPVERIMDALDAVKERRGEKSYI